MKIFVCGANRRRRREKLRFLEHFVLKIGSSENKTQFTVFLIACSACRKNFEILTILMHFKANFFTFSYTGAGNSQNSPLSMDLENSRETRFFELEGL